jgi:hypothetical protein
MSDFFQKKVDCFTRVAFELEQKAKMTWNGNDVQIYTKRE